MSVTTESQKIAGKRGTRQRLSADDAATVREVLALAAQQIEPEDRSQRQLFAALMPDLYVLRMKGFGFAQLTSLLNECGFALQPSTVRAYYQDMLASKMDLCEARFDKRLVVLAKVEELTSGEEVAAYAAKIAEGQGRQRAAVAARVDAVFQKQAQPVNTRRVEIEAAAQAPREEVPKARVKTTPPAAATVETSSAQDDSGDFGLLAGASSQVEVRPGAGFIVMDDDAPKVPVLDETSSRRKNDNASAAPAKRSMLRCAKLQKDIEPIGVRDEVPPEVYMDGGLEHPAVAGLMLNKEQRLYGALLEIIDESGVIRVETVTEKRFRIKWKQPIPMAETATSKNFVAMDASLFRKAATN